MLAYHGLTCVDGATPTRITDSTATFIYLVVTNVGPVCSITLWMMPPIRTIDILFFVGKAQAC